MVNLKLYGRVRNSKKRTQQDQAFRKPLRSMRSKKQFKYQLERMQGEDDRLEAVL